MKGKAIAIALVLLLVVVAAGCGSKKKAASSGSGTTTAAATTTAATTTTESTTSGSGSKPSFASIKHCAALGSIGQQFAAAMAAASGSGGGKPDLAKEEQLFNDFAKAAPSEIRPDLQTIASALGTYVEALKKSGYTLGSSKPPTPAQLVALESAVKSLSQPKLQAASTHLEAWATKNCG
jgi:hypothetical protein